MLCVVSSLAMFAGVMLDVVKGKSNKYVHQKPSLGTFSKCATLNQEWRTLDSKVPFIDQTATLEKSSS